MSMRYILTIPEGKTFAFEVRETTLDEWDEFHNHFVVIYNERIIESGWTRDEAASHACDYFITIGADLETDAT